MTQFSFPPPGRQIFVQAFLADYRRTGLHEALRESASRIPADVLRRELLEYTPVEGLQAVQGKGIRDEAAFATPTLLRDNPGLLAYYRLLLGISRKVFYTTKTGLSLFNAMEERQVVTPAAVAWSESHTGCRTRPRCSDSRNRQ